MKLVSNAFMRALSAVAIACAATACGSSGGGGGSGDSVTIQGTLRNDSATARQLQPGEGGIPGVQVSALGDTAMTDENGNFTLMADGNAFGGGTVQFTFSGPDFAGDAVLEGVLGGPGATAYTDFVLENSGNIYGESSDAEGNVLGRTPGGQLGCSQIGTFVDGALGALWKPHSERTGTPAILMPPQYHSAEVTVLNVRGEPVDGPILRNCCEHNGGRAHVWVSRSANDLLGAGIPLTVRFSFPDGFTDCRVVDNPTVRYD